MIGLFSGLMMLISAMLGAETVYIFGYWGLCAAVPIAVFLGHCGAVIDLQPEW